MQIHNENAQKMSCRGTGEVQHAARDLKPPVINLIILSSACQDGITLRDNLMHVDIIYL